MAGKNTSEYEKSDLRLIAGAAHGRKLTAPRGMKTRPATARVRASIFSRLAAREIIEGAHVLDLFAGSGALGLEALSRGAESAVFVDLSRAACSTITHNLKALRLDQRGRVIAADVRRALPGLSGAGEEFDIVLIDAPFTEDITAEVLALISHLGLLAPNGLAVTRQFHRAAAPGVDGLVSVSAATIGDHRIMLYRLGEGSEMNGTERQGE
jgi:16S rRNA (guanine966-N2)-methyltransferase